MVVARYERSTGMDYVMKGTRIRARWLGPVKRAGLARYVLKSKLTEYVVEGTIRHIYGDDPVAPTKHEFLVDPDASWWGDTEHCPKCGHEHVLVDPRHVEAIIG
jgi:hypothetical protein